jgi:tetratricopeptide (TPR) repeat protein
LLYADSQASEESLVWAQRMQEHATQKQQWRYQMRSLLRIAQAQHLLGRYADAFAAIEQAVGQYKSKKQTLEDEPELFATYALVAAAVGQRQLAAEATQQAQQALHAQLALIPDPMLRQSFLRVQRPILSYAL